MEKISVENNGYGIVFKSLTKNPNIDVEAKGLFAYLTTYAGAKDNAYPSVDLICYELNISTKRFQKYRKQLVEAGYLSISREKSSNLYGRNVYTLHHEPRQVQIRPVENESMQIESVENLPTKNNSSKNHSIKNNSPKNNSATKVASELENQLTKEFENWYNLYDKKKDRKAAFTKFKTARKKHSYEEIVKGTKEYLKTITDKQYQKYPKTFLNNESYLDDYSNDIKNNESSYLDKVFNKEKPKQKEDPFDEVL